MAGAGRTTTSPSRRRQPRPSRGGDVGGRDGRDAHRRRRRGRFARAPAVADPRDVRDAVLHGEKAPQEDGRWLYTHRGQCYLTDALSQRCLATWEASPAPRAELPPPDDDAPEEPRGPSALLRQTTRPVAPASRAPSAREGPEGEPAREAGGALLREKRGRANSRRPPRRSPRGKRRRRGAATRSASAARPSRRGATTSAWPRRRPGREGARERPWSVARQAREARAAKEAEKQRRARPRGIVAAEEEAARRRPSRGRSAKRERRAPRATRAGAGRRGARAARRRRRGAAFAQQTVVAEDEEEDEDAAARARGRGTVAARSRRGARVGAPPSSGPAARRARERQRRELATRIAAAKRAAEETRARDRDGMAREDAASHDREVADDCAREAELAAALAAARDRRAHAAAAGARMLATPLVALVAIAAYYALTWFVAGRGRLVAAGAVPAFWPSASGMPFVAARGLLAWAVGALAWPTSFKGSSPTRSPSPCFYPSLHTT